MAEPAYMRIRHRKEFIPGPITECGEDNLWQIHEFAHEISGFPLLNPSPLSHWDTMHKVVKVVLEIGAFLPRLYGVRVDQGEYINRVEIFWRQCSEKQKKYYFYFKHTIYPVKITSIKMFMPNVKDLRYERYNHLVSIDFRYRFIEHLYSEGYLHNKAEWRHFFADESDEPIPEKYLSGRCLSHEALEWEENWRKSQNEISLSNPVWSHTDEKRKEESPKKVAEGDKIKLSVGITGADEGQKVSFIVINKGKEKEQKIAFIDGQQKNGICSVEWTVDKSEIKDRENIFLVFKASCVGKSTKDIEIPIEGFLWAELFADDDLPLNNVKFLVCDTESDDVNPIYTGLVDENGRILVPFGKEEKHTIQFIFGDNDDHR